MQHIVVQTAGKAKACGATQANLKRMPSVYVATGASILRSSAILMATSGGKSSTHGPGCERTRSTVRDVFFLFFCVFLFFICLEV